MEPIKTSNSNFVYRGTSLGAKDLHCQRVIFKDEHTGEVQGSAILSVWEPTKEEREAIAKGANVRLWVMSEPIPPVLVDAVAEPRLTDN